MSFPSTRGLHSALAGGAIEALLTLFRASPRRTRSCHDCDCEGQADALEVVCACHWSAARVPEMFARELSEVRSVLEYTGWRVVERTGVGRRDGDSVNFYRLNRGGAKRTFPKDGPSEDPKKAHGN